MSNVDKLKSVALTVDEHKICCPYCEQRIHIPCWRERVADSRLTDKALGDLLEHTADRARADEYGRALSYMQGWKYKDDYTKNFNLRREGVKKHD